MDGHDPATNSTTGIQDMVEYLGLYQPIRLVLWSPVEANFANVLRISQVGIEQRQLAGAKMCELRV